MLLSAGTSPGGRGRPTISIEQPHKHKFLVTSMEWKFEICSTTPLQGGRFGKTLGILIHEWSLLPRQRELPEHELVMGLPYPWKVVCKRTASRKDQLYKNQQSFNTGRRS